MKDSECPTPQPEHLRVWQEAAACRSEDSALFFGAPTEQRRARLRREAKAKAVCWQCPVLALCRDHALRVEEPAGIWGALTEEEREQILMPNGSSNASALWR